MSLPLHSLSICFSIWQSWLLSATLTAFGYHLGLWGALNGIPHAAASVPPTTPKSVKKTRFVGMSKSGSSSEDEESSTGLSSIKAGPSEECKLVYLNWSELCLNGPSDPIPLGTHSTIRSGNDKRKDCGTMQVHVLSCPFCMNTLSSSGFSIVLCFKCMYYSHATLMCYKALLKSNPAVHIWMTLPMMEAKFLILWDPMLFLSCGISP